MGDIAGANAFLALGAVAVVGAFWGAWKGKPYLVFGWIAIGAAYTVFSAAKLTWGLG